MKKIKYLGICATALLTISPMVSSLVPLAASPLNPQIVQADAASDYEDSLTKGFVDHLEVTESSLRSLTEADLANANGTSTNPAKTGLTGLDSTTLQAKQEFTKSEFYGSTNDEASSLAEALQVKFLKQFVKKDAKLGKLKDGDYNTTVQIAFDNGSSSSSTSASTTTLAKLKSLTAGQSFTVTLTAKKGSESPKTKEIKVIVAANTKVKLVSLKDLAVDNNSNVAAAQEPASIVSAISASNSSSTIAAANLGTDFYYAVEGQSEYTTLSNKFNYPSGATLVQLIPIKYTPEIAAKYDPSSFVALKNRKTTSELPDPYASTPGDVYLMRKIVVGNPSFPVFWYTSDEKDVNGNRIRNPLMNGSTLIPNATDKQNLVYRYNDQNSLQALSRYLNNGFQSTNTSGGNLAAYATAGSEESQSKITINFELPDVKATKSPQTVVAKAYNSQNGKTSQINIPVTVTDIPNSNLAPQITKFPGSAVIVNRRVVSSYNPLSNVEATYRGTNNSTNVLPSSYIKVTVTDAQGANVNLNYDGSVPTTKLGTYTIHYVFSNPLDATKSVTKDLTLKVVDTTLEAPNVTGFNDNAIYTLSNVSHKEVSPLAPLLGMGEVKATYKSLDGNTYSINQNNITYQIKNAAGQSVGLNEHSCIPMTAPQTYTITYIWTNPEDPSKVTKKTSTLIVNAVTSQPIEARYTGNGVADPIIDTNTKSFNVFDNISFRLSYTDPNSSTPLNTLTETVSNNYVKVKVTKNNQTVTLTNNAFVPTEGVYQITYTITNPKDNAIVSTYTRKLTVNKPEVKPTNQPTVTSAQGVVWINYVPGYGINLWLNYNNDDGAERNADGSYRKLEHGSAWKFSAIATYADGTQWYRLGNHQWIQDKYASLTPIQPVETWQITNQNGVGRVNYVPGYGINVWTSPEQRIWTKKLNHGTAWKYFKIAQKGNVTMYNLGGNQWVDGSYFVSQP